MNACSSSINSKHNSLQKSKTKQGFIHTQNPTWPPVRVSNKKKQSVLTNLPRSCYNCKRTTAKLVHQNKDQVIDGFKRSMQFTNCTEKRKTDPTEH
jgi:hypothetical protein